MLHSIYADDGRRDYFFEASLPLGCDKFWEIDVAAAAAKVSASHPGWK